MKAVPDKNNTTVCMLSCQHSLKDDRIYWKESLSLQRAGYKVVHIGIGSERTDYVTREGIRLVQLKKKIYFSNIFLNRFFNFLTFRKHFTTDIFHAASSIHAAVYHFHDLQLNRIGKRLKKLPQTPVVIYDVHESYPDLIRDHSPSLLRPLNYLYAFFIGKWELRRAKYYDALITTEEYVWKKFSTNLPKTPCHIIFNYSYFMPGSDQLEKHDKLYDAVYSGTITRTRGIVEIIEAVHAMKQYRPGVCVLIIGSFPSSRFGKEVQSMIQRLGLAGNIIIHEPVAFEKMGDFYASGKIGLCVVHPLQLYTNAVFIKTFEYMAFGLPVIGSNFGTIAHYINAAGAGVTVDPLQPAAIANALLNMLNDPVQYKTCSDNGVTAVREKYNWKSEEKKLLALYKEIL